MPKKQKKKHVITSSATDSQIPQTKSGAQSREITENVSESPKKQSSEVTQSSSS